ncbi:MAG: TetR/AcrR family transcriptional regulator [Euzebyales bacterium]|nr:TetR/AcrR family transcriptional regulator [Euzebyales bacterium]
MPAPPAPSPRLRLSAAERRPQLLDVAGALFAELGFHGVSMEQLADAAGVSKPVLYQHFGSKRDLYLAVVRDTITEMEAQVRKALEGTQDNRARVEGAIAAYFAVVEDRRFQLVFGTGDLADPDVRAEVEAATSRLAERVGALIAADAGLSGAAAAFLASAVRGLAMDGARWWAEHPIVDREEAVRLLARLVWRGLGSFGPDAPHAQADR